MIERRNARARGAVAVLALGATIVSTSPILAKAAGLAGVGPTAIGVWRCLLGALFAGALARLLGVRLVPQRQALPLLVLAGVAFAMDLFAWHRAILLVGAGMATLLASVQVFVTATLSALLYRERLTLRLLGAATAGMAGVALLVGIGSDVAFTSDYLRGIGYGLATGFFYGMFLVSLRAAGRRSREGDALTSLVWFSGLCGLTLLGVGLGERVPLLPPSFRALLFLVLLALLAQCLGWWAISRSLPRVDGAVGSLVLLLQPLLSTIWSALVFGETLTPLQLVGGIVTLAAVYVGSTRR